MGSGKKGGGGGGSSGTTFQTPAGLAQGAQSETGLGQYATSVLNPISSMINWAANLATGGHATAVPTYESQAVQAGPQVYFGSASAGKGGNNLWNTSFDPQTGLVTFTNSRDPAQTFTENVAGDTGSLDAATKQKWIDAWNQNRTGQQAAGGSQQVLGGAYGDQLLPGISMSQVNQWYAEAHPGQDASKLTDSQKIYAFNQAWSQSTGQQVGSAGPQLTEAWQSVQAQKANVGQMAGIESQTQAAIDQAKADQAKYAGQGDVEYGQAQQFYTLGGQQEQQAQSIFGTAATQEAQAQQFYQRGNIQEQQAQQLYGVGYKELSAADKQIVDAHALVKMTTTGEGLFPAQAAMIDQARKSEEAQLASTLGSVGLGRSTQLAQMEGAADQAAAATAGQLQQGNIQAAEQVLSGAISEQAGAQKTLGLAQTGAQAAAQTYGLGISQEQVAGQTRGQAISEQEVAAKTYGLGQTQEQIAQQSYQLSQAAQKISLAGQELLTGEQAQVAEELKNITTESVQMQQVTWNEAMSGYGILGQILQGASQSYGYSLDAYKSVLNNMTSQNQINAQSQEAAQSSDQQGTSSLLGAIGSLFGSIGGGGGAAAGGAAAGGTAAAAGGSAAAGGGIAAAVSALFCEVAQEIYGFDNPKWERFRKWLLFRGPRWFLRFYGRNARPMAAWLSNRPRIKGCLRVLMDAVAH